MRRFAALLILAALAASAEPLPAPGSPNQLTDWLWLARPPLGQRTTLAGQEPLAPAGEPGQYLLLAVDGPGVLDHLVVRDSAATLTILVDGEQLWSGAVRQLLEPPEEGAILFPSPIANLGGLLAPVGFRSSLRIVTDMAAPERYLSYRTFGETTVVSPADADPAGAYARGLQAVAASWRSAGEGWRAAVPGPRQQNDHAFELPARSRVTALTLPGSGEVTHLALEFAPALMGALREVVVEFTYDGAAEPALRLPVTDLTGLSFPWPLGRWDTHMGALASGVRYPVHAENRAIVLPHARFYFNLPLPFARGLRIDLVNRSARRAFSGSVRAVTVPAEDAATAGRLCGLRVVAPVTAGMAPLVTLPGSGQLAAIGYFGTGNLNRNPIDAASWVAMDDAPPLRSPALLPLWSIWPWQTTPILMHPRKGGQYVGAMRHFLTDPLPFSRQLTIGYDPGSDLVAAPKQAVVIALWYRFGGPPFVAPDLPAQAEALPSQRFVVAPPTRDARLARMMEAEVLAPMAVVHGGQVEAVADDEEIFHPSGGRYLRVRLDRLLAYADTPIHLPASRYLAIGIVGLTGPVNGISHSAFELELLTRTAALNPPGAVSPGQRPDWSVVGGGPMGRQIFIPGPPGYRRDGGVDFGAPLLNPSPDAEAIFRITRRGPGATLIRLDQIAFFLPPPAASGWLEGEDARVSTEGDISAQLAPNGRFAWSGWGALELAASGAGTATLSWLIPTIGPTPPRELVLTGSLAPDSGQWQLRLLGSPAPPLPLTAGKDANELVTWRLPIDTGLTLPGPLVVHVSSVLPESTLPQKTAILHVDACHLE